MPRHSPAPTPRTNEAGSGHGRTSPPGSAASAKRSTAALWSTLALLAAACASPGIERTAPIAKESRAEPGEAPLLILVSIDGFRWDYLERTATPNLDRLAASGVRAERMIPSFPSKTFPSHYSIVTGLHAGNHGIVANNMWDPELETHFTLRKRDEVENGRWYGGEPIWVTAERQGLVTSPYFWPGAAAEIGGIRPTFVDSFDGGLAYRERIDVLLGRLDLDPPRRPSFATVYFELVDSAGHDFDPDRAPEVAAAIRAADALIGYLLDGLAARGLERHANLIVVSDHGMAANSPERAIRLDELVDLDRANVVDWNPLAALWPEPDDVDAVYRALVGAHPHLAVYRRDEVPERFHYRDHRRIPPILALADEGWVITTSRALEIDPGSFPGGSHGYDNRLVSMGALFIASGPAFRSGLVVPPFENVHVYELMCAILGLEPAPNDGDLEAVRHLLAAPK